MNMLTEHQSDKLCQCLSILQRSNRLLIKGSAGVGKTYLVNTLIKNLDIRGYILCTAPTNKAVAVLKSKVDSDKNITFTTTHSALKLKRVIDFKTGNISFKPSFSDKYPPLKNIKLLIIDEASMVNSEMLEHIEEHANEQNTKVIFIGDEKQLNPVGEDESPVFIAGYPEVELTEIIRQGEGNPIIDLSRNLDLIDSKVENKTDIGGYIYSNDRERVVETLAAVNGTDELKYLAWTNKEVDLINFLVRKRIYGNPKKIELGESIIFNAPYGDYFTNEEITVNDLRVCTNTFNYINNKVGDTTEKNTADSHMNTIDIKLYIVNDNIKIIHEDSEKEFKKVVDEMKKKAKISVIDWKDYYEFAEQFADVKYNHAITVHKSQGSTYKQVIVNVRNLKLNKNLNEKEKLFYTAITRSSKLLILYNV